MDGKQNGGQRYDLARLPYPILGMNPGARDHRGIHIAADEHAVLVAKKGGFALYCPFLVIEGFYIVRNDVK